MEVRYRIVCAACDIGCGREWNGGKAASEVEVASLVADGLSAF